LVVDLDTHESEINRSFLRCLFYHGADPFEVEGHQFFARGADRNIDHLDEGAELGYGFSFFRSLLLLLFNLVLVGYGSDRGDVVEAKDPRVAIRDDT
jgi:hypothetical protein